MEKRIIDIVYGNSSFLSLSKVLDNLDDAFTVVACPKAELKYKENLEEFFSKSLSDDAEPFFNFDFYSYRLWFGSMTSFECLMVGAFLSLLESKGYKGEVQLYDVFRLTNEEMCVASLSDCNLSDIEKLLKMGPEITTLPFEGKGPYCHYPEEWNKYAADQNYDKFLVFKEAFYRPVPKETVFKYVFKLIENRKDEKIKFMDLVSFLMVKEFEYKAFPFGNPDKFDWMSVINEMVDKGFFDFYISPCYDSYKELKEEK